MYGDSYYQRKNKKVEYVTECLEDALNVLNNLEYPLEYYRERTGIKSKITFYLGEGTYKVAVETVYD